MQRVLKYYGPQHPPQAPDTQLKKATAYIATGSRTRAAQVLEMVKHDAQGNCHVAETEEFLDKLFPVEPSIVNDVYSELLKSGAYDQDNEVWKDMPKSSKKESEYYAPFVTAAEAIRKAHSAIEEVPYRNIWVARPNQAPKLKDPAAVLIRPDVMSILGLEGESDKWETLIAGSKEEAERLKAIVAWWLRVHVVVEIKPAEGKDILDHIYQLMGYLRQVLREQVDRRFVPGMLLCKTELSVWLADRSGVLGTETTFNIHKYPKCFIQIILACSALPPERLGYDLTMRLCRHPILPNPTPIFSFDKQVNLSDYRQSLYNQHWVIEMPSTAGNGENELFITIRALSIIRAETTSGRATIVWAVMKMDDLQRPPPHKIFVLKQCWRPETATSEGKMYPSGDHGIHVSRIYCFSDVCDQGGVVDTQHYIRHGISHHPPSTRPDRNDNGKRESDQLGDAERREPYIHVIAKSDDTSALSFATDSEQDPIWRVQTRLLMEDYGWPLHHFRDLLELLKLLKHIVEALHDLYLKGVLHRDISISNMLICMNESLDGVEGRLIDLDYAKMTSDMKGPLMAMTKDSPLNATLQAYLQAEFQVPFSDEVMRALDFFRMDHLEYLHSVKALSKDFAAAPKILGSHIGLLDSAQKVPNFQSHRPQKGKRSATYPFASSEVLSSRRIFKQKYPKAEPQSNALGVTKVPAHNEKHDLEATFWSLNFVCITREGPGGKRRKELLPQNQSSAPRELLLVNYCLFSSEDIVELADNKRELLQDDDEYEVYILSQFHPYFWPLRPLMKKWWQILRLAHEYPVFEATHEWFLRALDETIDELKKKPPSEPLNGARDVDKTRKEDLLSLQSFPGPNEGGQPVPSLWDMSPSNDLKPAHPTYHGGAPDSPTPKSKKPKT
ncbi:hypothetical protein Hypma_014319 [Hypsizygus marmoreus]|uniref:Fungal-type protein kinase domain-containing protein n=1 Tax=Hypsizygus marmoreus TaxID=39966 RepID=A0A369JET7_HYPMA|nr:hypothetical protein Hypma_014319 [Hypsizygus marmoreus]